MIGDPILHEFFMSTARESAVHSNDPHTKLGCVLVVTKGAVTVVSGANRTPPGVDRDRSERFERPEKYLWIEHAERDVIGQAAAMGVRTSGATMYLPWFPCPECARMIVRAEIAELVCYVPTPEEFADPKWKFDRARAILEEGRVNIVDYPKEKEPCSRQA